MRPVRAFDFPLNSPDRGGRIGRMASLREMGRNMGSLVGRLLPGTPQAHPVFDSYELTYAGCADFLIRTMVAEEPPFDHGEWHTALIQRELPSGGLDAITPGLDATFEFICWMNSLAVFVSGIIGSQGEESGYLLIRELEEQLIARLPDAGPKLVMLFRAELTAAPLPSDHPVFAANLKKDSKHLSNPANARVTEAFGRAKAALDHVTEIDSEEALSLLGPCIVYGTACSGERFSSVIPKIRFIEVASTELQANEADGTRKSPAEAPGGTHA